MKFYWIKTIDGTQTNFGDTLTPWILNHYNVVCEWSENPDYVGIGSLLHSLPNNTAKIWTTGFMYPTHTIDNECIAVRGKYSREFCKNASLQTPLGDGGLLLSKIYNPKPTKKYVLGIVIHYSDEQHVNITDFSVVKSPLVTVIKPYGAVADTIDRLNECQYIISSSLHGLITADSYGIMNSPFVTDFSKEYIHRIQASFKFRDYYSVWNQDFRLEDVLELTNKTTLEECVSKCIQWSCRNRGDLEQIQTDLESSIKYLV